MTNVIAQMTEVHASSSDIMSAVRCIKACISHFAISKEYEHSYKQSSTHTHTDTHTHTHTYTHTHTHSLCVCIR